MFLIIIIITFLFGLLRYGFIYKDYKNIKKKKTKICCFPCSTRAHVVCLRGSLAAATTTTTTAIKSESDFVQY
jgi:hypothetical protein